MNGSELFAVDAQMLLDDVPCAAGFLLKVIGDGGEARGLGADVGLEAELEIDVRRIRKLDGGLGAGRRFERRPTCAPCVKRPFARLN